jgi:hypothetical protein
MIGVALLVSCPTNDLLTSIQQKVQEAKGGLVATPQSDPAPGADGTYTSSSDFTVTITCATSGATIHYTTDGSTPTVSTTEYTTPIPVAGNGTTLTIKAVGTKSGMTDSALAQGTYKVNYTQVSTPQFVPPAGTYSTDQSVTISTTTSGATIYYTTDGSDPTTSSTKLTYGSTPIPVTGPSTNDTIKAYATKAGMSDSTVESSTYTINYPKVSYDGNGSTSGTAPVDSNSYRPGQTVTVLDYGSLSKTGNKYFSSWNTEADGSGTKRSPGSTFAIGSANVTLYAQWPLDLIASDGAASDFFGSSVVVSGDGNTLVIGAYNKTVGANSGQGEAYVFAKSGISCSLTQELKASAGASGDDFGRSVAASSDGSTLVIGAPGYSGGTSQGAVYVFTWSGTAWTQQASSPLTASGGSSLDLFGTSVAVSGDGSTLVIGAYNKNVGNNTNQGAAYVFTWSGSSWSQAPALTASGGASDDFFGYSVAVSGDGKTLLIGAFRNSLQGAAYVFTWSGSSWSQAPALTASDGASGDEFGYSVAMSSDGSILVIGAFNKNSSQGAAYVFTKSGSSWSQTQELTASDGAASDDFGYRVAESGDGSTVVIGAFNKNIGSTTSQGAAYVFGKSGSSWSQTRRITATDGTAYDYFGTSVAASSDGSTLVIGANSKNIGSNSKQGAAYVF